VRFKIRTHFHDLVTGLCPTEVFLLLFLALSGATVLFNLGPPDSLSALLPHGIVLAWETMLLVGSLITLTGLVLLEPVISRVGYTLLCPATLAYAIAVAPLVMTSTGWISVGVLITFSLSCAWRIVQITWLTRQSGGDA
jgi:hypothetical protein